MHTFRFTHFKPYAAYLLEHKLEPATQSLIEAYRKVNLPLLNKLSHLSPDALFAVVNQSLHDFLYHALHDTALTAALHNVNAWREKQSPYVQPDQVELEDIVSVYAIRKRCLIGLLNGFTADTEVVLLIVDELEAFFTAVQKHAFSAYVAIQQEALAQERDFVASLINNSVNGVLSFNRELVITSWNTRLEEWYGLAKAQVLGKHILQVFPNYEQTEEGKAVYRVLDGEKVHIRDARFRHRPGYYEADLIPLYDSQGAVTGGFSIIRDTSAHKQAQAELQTAIEELNRQIDQRRQAEEKLRRSLDYYLTILEDFPSLIWRTGAEGQRNYFNHTWLTFTGRTLAQEAGEGWIAGIHPEDVQSCLRTNTEAFAGRTPFTTEYRLKRHDGEYRWLIEYGKPLYDLTGEFTGFIGSCVDIEDDKQAQKQIRENQRFMDKITQASPTVVFVVDLSRFQIVYTNKDVMQLLGYSSRQIEERKLAANSDLIHPEDIEQRNAYFANLRTIGEDEVREIEYRVKDAGNRWRTFLTRSVLFEHNSAGEATQVMGISLDVTARAEIQTQLEKKNLALSEAYQELAATQEELEQTNEDLYQTNAELEKRVERRTEQLTQVNESLQTKNIELQRLNEDMDNFIYTASHDLRAPIANLEGITRLLLTRLATRLMPPEQELLRHASYSVSRLKQTIADLTDIARVQKDLDAKTENLLFSQVFADVQEDIAALIADAQARIDTRFDEERIQFARKNLKSILYNLLSNAIKYRSFERTPHIQVHTYRNDAYTVLSVSDNGLGIPEKQQDKIFKMFKRLHSHVEGTGIGLYIVKRIVENSGGRVNLSSREGEGSTFYVYFR
jgi:PAS domain S-box-containing protein